MSDKIYIIIPAYNEEKYISTVLKKVSKIWPYIVVVDDGSHDKTAKMARKLCKHVLSHALNLGKGAALKTGCDYAFKKLKATGVIFIDADDQHDPVAIPKMIAALKETPVVFGVRAFNNQMPLIRIMANRFASFLLLLLFGTYIPDIPSGFKAMNKKAYNLINWKSHDYAVEMEIAARVSQYKLNYTEVPIKTIYHDLDRGMTVLDSLHMIILLLNWRIWK